MGKRKGINRPLDNRERTFLGEYLIGLDPKRAAITAGYSKTVACSKAYQWVSNSKVKPHLFMAIEKAMDLREKRTQIRQDRVLKELAKAAFFNARELFDDNGDLVAVRDLPADISAAIGHIDITSYLTEGGDLSTTSKFRILDKLRALELIGRHLKMFTDKNQLNGQLSIGQIIKDIQGRKRADILPPPSPAGEE